MSQVATIQPKRSLVDSMAAKYEMEPAAFVSAIKATVIKGDCSNEQFAAFLMVAKEYDLNPLTKEIYAFPDRGGITPIVSIDGWMNLINSHPQFDGMEFDDAINEDGKLVSVECRMYRKDRNRPTSVIEYMSECYRQTDPWKKWPNRMLRHKAAIQCARYAFGFSGIMEPDEYERMRDITPATDKPSVMERLQANAAKAPSEATREREGFAASSVHQQTDRVLTGEIMPDEQADPETGEITETQTTDAPSPSASDGDDASSPTAASSNEPEGTVPPPSGSSSSEPSIFGKFQFADGELVHLKDFARKSLDEAAGDSDAPAKVQFVERMFFDYLDAVISAEAKDALRAMGVPTHAVIDGKRTREQAAAYIAREILDCPASDLEGRK